MLAFAIALRNKPAIKALSALDETTERRPQGTTDEGFYTFADGFRALSTESPTLEDSSRRLWEDL
ncbi:MAG: hypothetical protein R3B07_23310 [Polyangiaceae bacterium]